MGTVRSHVVAHWMRTRVALMVGLVLATGACGSAANEQVRTPSPVAADATTSPGAEPAIAPVHAGAFLREIDCPTKPSTPRGTDILSINLEHNTPALIQIAARFNGTIPAVSSNVRPGTISLSVDLLLYTSKTDQRPYSLFVNQLSGTWRVQAGRVGGGFIDSSGVSLTVSEDTIRVALSPAVFTQLPPDRHFLLGADTIVSRYQESTGGTGFFLIGEEHCPT